MFILTLPIKYICNNWPFLYYMRVAVCNTKWLFRFVNIVQGYLILFHRCGIQRSSLPTYYHYTAKLLFAVPGCHLTTYNIYFSGLEKFPIQTTHNYIGCVILLHQLFGFLVSDPQYCHNDHI
jgi:hypothetical protein